MEMGLELHGCFLSQLGCRLTKPIIVTTLSKVLGYIRPSPDLHKKINFYCKYLSIILTSNIRSNIFGVDGDSQRIYLIQNIAFSQAEL